MNEETHEAERPKLPSPSARLHEVTIAALTRAPVKASEEVEMTRNAKGDTQIRVAGVVGSVTMEVEQGETLDEAAARVLATYRLLCEAEPLSRSQEYGRKYTPNEKSPK